MARPSCLGFGIRHAWCDMPEDVNAKRPLARAPRTRLAPGLRRELLLDVAMGLFERRPYDAVTLEGIAETAGVSPALVHHYFGTKREVFLGVVVRAIAGFQQAISAAPTSTSSDEVSARERLRAALGRYLDFVLDRPNGYAFVIGARGTPDDEVRFAIDTAREQVHRALLLLVGIPEPDLVQDLGMWGWIGFVERVTTRWVAQGGNDRDGLVEVLLGAAAPLLAEDR
jgi:AcrR family transcriptional regulator